MRQIKNISNKIDIVYAQEKTDLRFVPEVVSASRFANTSTNIKKIIMNSENPSNINHTTVLYVKGNKYKDVTVTVQLENNRVFSFDQDIKFGNNANNPFSGVLAEIPLINATTPYAVINTPLSFDKIQQNRLEYLRTLSLKKDISKTLLDSYSAVQEIINLPLDDIKKNILIQEQMFKTLSENLLQQRPSFYYAFMLIRKEQVNSRFFKKIEPYINSTIFDNAKNYQEFMKVSLTSYAETIEDISSKIRQSKNIWYGIGFEHIADDLFQ